MKRGGAVFKTNPVEILQDKTKQRRINGIKTSVYWDEKVKKEKKSSKKNEQGVKCRVWSLRRGNYRVTITSNDKGKFFIYVPCKPRKVYLPLYSPAIFHVRCRHLAHLRAIVCPLYWLESGGWCGNLISKCQINGHVRWQSHGESGLGVMKYLYFCWKRKGQGLLPTRRQCSVKKDTNTIKSAPTTTNEAQWVPLLDFSWIAFPVGVNFTVGL